MSHLTFRNAGKEDLPVIVALLADDDIGAGRESTIVLAEYERAFDEISAARGIAILLAEHNGEIVGSFQLVIIPSLSRRGTRRALIEAVRIRADKRGQGFGTAMIRHAIGQAHAAGCGLVQLTSDKRRTRAHLFYERLGFARSHDGFKLELEV